VSPGEGSRAKDHLVVVLGRVVFGQPEQSHVWIGRVVSKEENLERRFRRSPGRNRLKIQLLEIE